MHVRESHLTLKQHWTLTRVEPKYGLPKDKIEESPFWLSSPSTAGRPSPQGHPLRQIVFLCRWPTNGASKPRSFDGPTRKRLVRQNFWRARQKFWRTVTFSAEAPKHRKYLYFSELWRTSNILACASEFLACASNTSHVGVRHILTCASKTSHFDVCVRLKRSI